MQPLYHLKLIVFNSVKLSVELRCEKEHTSSNSFEGHQNWVKFLWQFRCSTKIVVKLRHQKAQEQVSRFTLELFAL